MKNLELIKALTHAWRNNNRGGWHARWERRMVWPALFAQRLGLHRRVTARLFWGARMEVLTGETISRMILAFGYSEAALTALLCDLAAPGDALVDVGTHFGYESVLMARITGPAGAVDAFEPNPEVAAFAARNLIATPWAHLHRFALSDVSGSTSFGVPSLAQSAFGGLRNESLHRIEVELRTLDEVRPPGSKPVALIKCDAEGHEAAILRGAGTLIARDHPALVLETGMPDANGKSAAAATDLTALLAPAGYHGFGFEFDGELRVGPLDTRPVWHANSLFLHDTHPRFAEYARGFVSRWTGLLPK